MIVMDPIIIEIGPPAKEPMGAMRKFLARDRYQSLRAFWFATHMSKTRRLVLSEMAVETGARSVKFVVPGLGVVGGFAKHEEAP